MNTDFYRELENSLAESNAQERTRWATIIVSEDLAIKDLSQLLQCKGKVARRFAWLLSDIGVIKPGKLFIELPFLFELSDEINQFNFQECFASYWLISGVPAENEARAIDLLFAWLQSAEANVTLKSRSLSVLFNMTKKYPELKNELKHCLEEQIDKNTKVFKKKSTKILEKL